MPANPSAQTGVDLFESTALPRYGLRVRKPESRRPDTFVAYLRRAMRAAGYDKPTYLARAAGVDPSVVIRWLRGDARPNVASLERLAPVLGVPVAELVAVAYPTTATPVEPADRPGRYLDSTTGEEYTHPAEQALWDLWTFSEDERRELIYFHRSRRMARQARLRRAG